MVFAGSSATPSLYSYLICAPLHQEPHTAKALVSETGKRRDFYLEHTLGARALPEAATGAARAVDKGRIPLTAIIEIGEVM